MPRLFITPKEIQLINDWTKELTKDVVGQTIKYYAISPDKSNINDVYLESDNKVFEPPVDLDILAGQPEWKTSHTKFGAEQRAKLELYVQARDLIDKGLQLSEGDYFTYDQVVYEVVSLINTGNIFGQEEYNTAFKITGKSARPGTFNPPEFHEPEEEAPIKEFGQQRGLPETKTHGPTGDIREVRDRIGNDNIPEVALGEGPRRVVKSEDGKVASVYDE